MKQLILIFIPLFVSSVSFATPSPITGVTTLCAGSTDTLSDATPGGTWSSSTPAVATVGSSTGAITGISAGTAIITYTAGGSYVTDTIIVMPVLTTSVSITSSPALPVTPGTTVRFMAVPVNSGSTPSYEWYVNGTTSGIGDTFTYNPLYGDIVTVCMRSSAMCASPEIVCISDSIPSPTAIYVINGAVCNIYPNPVENNLTVAYDFTGGEDGILQIMDITGHIIITHSLSTQKQKEVFDMSSLSTGMYIYKVIQNNMVISTGKLIKS